MKPGILPINCNISPQLQQAIDLHNYINENFSDLIFCPFLIKTTQMKLGNNDLMPYGKYMGHKLTDVPIDYMKGELIRMILLGDKISKTGKAISHWIINYYEVTIEPA